MGRSDWETEANPEPLLQVRRGTVIVGCAVVACLLGVIGWSIIHQRRIERARACVTTWSNRLDAQRTTEGRWVRWDGDTLPMRDPWGHPLRVRYDMQPHRASLIVSSDGPDGEQWSPDDIIRQTDRTDWVAIGKETADVVESVTSSVARGATKGAVSGVVQGVTESIPQPIKERLGIAPTPSPTPAEQK